MAEVEKLREKSLSTNAKKKELFGNTQLTHCFRAFTTYTVTQSLFSHSYKGSFGRQVHLSITGLMECMRARLLRVRVGLTSAVGGWRAESKEWAVGVQSAKRKVHNTVQGARLKAQRGC